MTGPKTGGRSPADSRTAKSLLRSNIESRVLIVTALMIVFQSEEILGLISGRLALISLLALVKLLAVAGSDRTVERVQPVVANWALAKIWPPPRSTPLVRQE